MSALRELIASFFVSADTKELEEADKKVTGFVGKLKEVAEVVAEAFAFEKVHEFVEQQVQVGAQLKIMSERLGVGTDELQSLHLAAEQAGVSAGALDTSLRFLNRNINSASDAGSKQAKAFKDLGIELKGTDGKSRGATAILGDLADKVSAIDDPAKRTAVAMQLLGRGGAQLIPLLKEGGGALEEAAKQAEALGGGLSEGFIEQAHEAEKAQVRLNFALEGFKSRVAGALLPYVEKAVSWLTQLATRAIELAKNTDTLSHAVQFFGAVAGLKAVQTVGKLLTEFGLLKPSILGSVKAMLGFAAPLLLLGLLYVAYDELATLLAGGDTLIGDALGPDKQAFVDSLRGAVDQLKGAFTDLDSTVNADGNSLGLFGDVVVGVTKGVAYLVEAINALVQGLGWVVEKSADATKALAHVFGVQSEGERRQFGDGSATGLTPYAKDLLDKSGVAPDQFAPITETARSRRRTTSDSLAPVQQTQTPYAPGALAPYFTPAQAPLLSAYGGAGGGTQVTVNQTFHNDIDVHGTDTNNGRAVGEAIGPGIASPVARAADKAYTSGNQP